MTFVRHVTHYAPNGSNGWCGRHVGFHTGLPASKHPERVTCKQCRASMKRLAQTNTLIKEVTR